MDEGIRRPRRGRDLERSLTLLRVFLLASALICAGAGVALGSILSHSLRTEALNAEETALVRYVDGVVRPTLVRDNHVKVPWVQDAQLGANVLTQPDIVTVKVWSLKGGHGVLAWTNPLSRSSSDRLLPNRDRHRIPSFPARRRAGRSRPRQPADRGTRRHRRQRRGRVRAQRSRLPTTVRGLCADREHDRNARDRCIRDLRESESSRPADRLAPHDPLVCGRRRLPGALVRTRAARARRIAHPPPPEREAPRPDDAARRVQSPARGERARSGREPERDRRRQGSVHGGALPAGAADRSRARRGAGARPGAARRASLRRPLPRHRQDRRARRDPHEAGPVD